MTVEETNDRVIISQGSSEVAILKYGASVISWKQEGKEQLWLSEAAKLDGSKPVRGGIPLVFPVFGKQKNENHPTYKLPQHGFARNSTWEFLGQTSESNPVTVQFGLGPENLDSEVAKIWDYNFTLIYSISLYQDKLVTQIEVENNGDKPFEFNWLFHTYYKIGDITDTLVNNLVDQNCFDQLINEAYTEKAPVISFHEEFDRIYKNINQQKVLQIIDKGKVLFELKRNNLPDSVVWNPWIEKSKGMADFEPKDGYLNMLCVEPGHVNSMILLNKNDKWQASQEISVGGEIKVQGNIY